MAINRVPAPNIDEIAIAPVDGEIFRRALQVTPPEQARAIGLVYFNGYSLREITEMPGVQIGTVRSRNRLGLHALHCKLMA